MLAPFKQPRDPAPLLGGGRARLRVLLSRRQEQFCVPLETTRPGDHARVTSPMSRRVDDGFKFQVIGMQIIAPHLKIAPHSC